MRGDVLRYVKRSHGDKTNIGTWLGKSRHTLKSPGDSLPSSLPYHPIIRQEAFKSQTPRADQKLDKERIYLTIGSVTQSDVTGLDSAHLNTPTVLEARRVLVELTVASSTLKSFQRNYLSIVEDFRPPELNHLWSDLFSEGFFSLLLNKSNPKHAVFLAWKKDLGELGFVLVSGHSLGAGLHLTSTGSDLRDHTVQRGRFSLRPGDLQHFQ
ncbi:hypothetical protein RRG08_012236 [Elysia crispata]|uniref:Uncharacterized protein n=1 Tax=Elysia crispata TaxID=231223 RepID=A0AAE0YNY0_9GAST|nr:hypothetical protein RRG08_012236 [Elysia crispata]